MKQETNKTVVPWAIVDKLCRTVSIRSFLYLSTVIRKRKAMSDIQEKIQQERDQARAVCDVKGAESGDCAAAWDVVEELQAEAAHQRQKGKKKNSLELYCDANPDADECRVYDD
jgi:hypothetical protein